MIIEIPKITDYTEINNLAKQVHELHVNWRPDLFADVENVIEKENLEIMIKNKEIYIAKENSKIIGYITVSVKDKTNPIMKPKKYLSIDSICVDKKNRNKGVGTALLDFSKELAKIKQCTDLYLTVNQENFKAIKLYEKFGFKVKNISYSMKI